MRPPKLSTTAAKAIFKLLISRNGLCVWSTPRIPVTPSPWLLLHGKGLSLQGTLPLQGRASCSQQVGQADPSIPGILMWAITVIAGLSPAPGMSQ